MRVSDPCHKKDMQCSRTIKGCLPGNWEVDVIQKELYGPRNALLVASHESCMLDLDGLDCGMKRILSPYKRFPFDVVVDSEQAGFFDENYYQKDFVIDPNSIRYNFTSWSSKHRLWYLACCDKTLLPPGAGCIPYGAVSASGWGDGSYQGGYHKNIGGRIDRVFISFL